ncbi:MAG: HD-GYP domain-containing protein [Clostridiaceae bacterium]|nr:HD-GYP domain-containing protein [Clostridiaceae bacterium]
MRKVTLDELQPGMKLAQDIILEDGRFLLLKGFTLRKRYLDKIRLYDIPYVFVENEIQKIEHISEEIIYSETYHTIKNVMKAVREGANVDVEAVKETVSEIVHSIMSNDNVFMNLTGIRDIDNYTYLHSVDVCIYSIITGKSMGLPLEVLNDLAMGAILHDIGKCKIPLNVLNKPAKLTDSEYELIKKHVDYGYDILSRTPGINEDVAKIALYHHEHWNGEGYPRGLKGEEIDYLSRIVAIADVYDALTANRVYRKRFMPHEAAEYIISNTGTQFDPQIQRIFIESIAIYPADIIVMLSTGEVARVVESKGPPSIRPKVMVITRKEGPPVLEPYVIDLAKSPEVSIVDIIS